MIITCESCSTRFQLPDERVPERGVRVRCSRCRHAFFVKPPVEREDVVEAAVASAVAEHAPGPEPSPSGTRLAEDESDWEFNHEATPAEPEPGIDAARRAVDDLLGGAPAVAPAAAAPDALDLGSDVDTDIDALLDAGPPAGAPTPSGLDVVGLDDPGPELGEPDLEEPAPIEEPDAGGPAAEELGSPESWDFFDDPEPAPEAAQPSVETVPMRIALGRIGEAPRRARSPVEVEVEPSPAGVWLARVGHAVGWLVFAALMAGVLHRGLWAEQGLPTGPVTSQSLEGFELTELRGRWIDNAAVGRIYVVSGSLQSTRSVRVPGTRIAVRLLDGRGQVLMEPAAFVGAPLPAAWLRELHPDELRRLAESVRPEAAPQGSPRAFSAVLSRVPGAAQRFELVALVPERATPASEDPPAGGPADAPAEGSAGMAS